MQSQWGAVCLHEILHICQSDWNPDATSSFMDNIWIYYNPRVMDSFPQQTEDTQCRLLIF